MAYFVQLQMCCMTIVLTEINIEKWDMVTMDPRKYSAASEGAPNVSDLGTVYSRGKAPASVSPHNNTPRVTKLSRQEKRKMAAAKRGVLLARNIRRV
jgi:hypothetical protein